MDNLTDALIQARQAAQALDRAKASITRLLRTLEGDVKAPFNAASIAAQHRAEHRTGVPSRIDADPELRAFILNRIEYMTYKQVVACVAEIFPPERQTSISALQRWWRKHAPQS